MSIPINSMFVKIICMQRIKWYQTHLCLYIVWIFTLVSTPSSEFSSFVSSFGLTPNIAIISLILKLMLSFMILVLRCIYKERESQAYHSLGQTVFPLRMSYSNSFEYLWIVSLFITLKISFWILITFIDYMQPFQFKAALCLKKRESTNTNRHTTFVELYCDPYQP